MSRDWRNNLKKSLAVVMVLSFFVAPGYGLAQILDTNSGTILSDDTILALGSMSEGLSRMTKINLNEIDKADWDLANLNSKDLDNYNKEIIIQLLPYLVSPTGGNLDSVTVDRIRRGYLTSDTNTSRETNSASNTSQHYYGKAVALSAIGSSSCATEVIFPRAMDPVKPLWIHEQTGESSKTTDRWVFGRSFDALARQFFWLEARAFTNRPITSLTWSNFLQQLAKGEIEERFGLAPGSLANSAVSDLHNVVARARLAHDLGLPDLPDSDSESEFFEDLGRRELEIELNLPRNSFVGDTWRQIYQQIGFRVLEQQLSLPEDTSNGSLFNDPQFLVSNSRFLQLKNRLEERGENYTDPRLAFNLPPEDYLPTNQEGQTIFGRITSGDPDAYAIAGAYFLADSLELSPELTKAIIQTVNTPTKGTDAPVIDLEQARPTDPTVQADTIFQSDVSGQAATFDAVGRQLTDTIKNHLPRLNNAVLTSLNNSSTAPKYDDAINIISRRSSRQNSLQALAKSSAEDANYFQTNTDGSFKMSDGYPIPGFTIENLRQRGVKLLADALDLNSTDIAMLETSPNDTETLTTRAATSDTIDRAMGWPSGTAQVLATNQSATSSNQLTDKQIVEIGSNILWERLRMPDTLRQAMQQYYFSATLPTNLPASQDSGDITETTDTDNRPIIEETDDSSETTIQADIPADQQSFANSLTQSTGLPDTDISFFLSGRMMPAMIRATLIILGKDINPEDGVFNPATLLNLFNNTSLADADGFADTADLPFIDPTFYPTMKQAVKDGNLYGVWKTVHQEAIYQWNISCPSRKDQAKTRLAQLVDTLVSLPAYEEIGTNEENNPFRPYQIFTFDTSILSSSTQQKITAAYEDADGETIKWGVYQNPRDWDHLYIGY